MLHPDFEAARWSWMCSSIIAVLQFLGHPLHRPARKPVRKSDDQELHEVCEIAASAQDPPAPWPKRRHEHVETLVTTDEEDFAESGEAMLMWRT